jgi:acyl-ACP thioesterase
MNNNQILDSNQTIYEESLATAIALKIFEKTEYFKKLKEFVENLSFCYRYSLEFLHFSIKNLIEIMEIWVMIKKDSHKFHSIKKYIFNKNFNALKKNLEKFQNNL